MASPSRYSAADWDISATGRQRPDVSMKLIVLALAAGTAVAECPNVRSSVQRKSKLLPGCPSRLRAAPAAPVRRRRRGIASEHTFKAPSHAPWPSAAGRGARVPQARKAAPPGNARRDAMVSL